MKAFKNEQKNRLKLIFCEVTIHRKFYITSTITGYISKVQALWISYFQFERNILKSFISAVSFSLSPTSFLFFSKSRSSLWLFIISREINSCKFQTKIKIWEKMKKIFGETNLPEAWDRFGGIW